MRRPRRHPLIILICALFLLGAQQAAYAHFLGHLGLAAETAATDGGDNEHGAATTLSHVCTTCAAFSALDGAVLVGDAAPMRGAAVVPAALAAAPATPFVTRAGPPAGARAPPLVR